MTTRAAALAPLGIALTVACTGGEAKIGSNDGNSVPTDCVQVVGGADCNGGGGGTATGGTGTGTGSTAGIDTWIGNDNPGSGPGVDLYRIEARVEADRKEGDNGFWYQTDMRVDIWDDQGAPARGLEVHLDTLSAGDTLLDEVPGNPGRYEATVDVYARTYTLQIEPGDPVAAFEAEVVGPAPHVFVSWPPEPWDVSGPDVEIQWTPSGATTARIDTRGTGGIDIADTGSYHLPVDQLDHNAGEIGEERVRLQRTQELDLVNALPTSWFHVSVQIDKDPVDTTDTRLGRLEGSVTLDGNYAGETGDVFVLAWPDALDPSQDPYAAWTLIPDGDFTDFGTYFLNDLEPGDWYLLAYLDADGSDAGQPAPDGPTLGDPFDDKDLTIDPNGTTTWNANLNQLWNGW